MEYGKWSGYIWDDTALLTGVHIERSRAKQSEAERSRAKQSEAERSRAKQSEAERSRAICRIILGYIGLDKTAVDVNVCVPFCLLLVAFAVPCRRSGDWRRPQLTGSHTVHRAARPGPGGVAKHLATTLQGVTQQGDQLLKIHNRVNKICLPNSLQE
jgi:hypothetical protein